MLHENRVDGNRKKKKRSTGLYFKHVYIFYILTSKYDVDVVFYGDGDGDDDNCWSE